jgi:hypothetical protein
MVQKRSAMSLPVLFERKVPLAVPFSVSWHTLLEELDDLSDGAALITPLSHDRFRITDVQEHRVTITFVESGDRHPLQREQFETLYRRIQDSTVSSSLTACQPISTRIRQS